MNLNERQFYEDIILNSSGVQECSADNVVAKTTMFNVASVIHVDLPVTVMAATMESYRIIHT